MDDVLRSALEPIFRDLRNAGVAPASIEDDEEWAGDPDSCRAMLWSADGTVSAHRGGAWWVYPRDRAPVVRIGALAG